MATSDSTLLVSTDWLAERLSAPDIRILDASLYLPGDGRDGYQEYLKGHIPGARFFDIDDIADQHSPLPHMLPPVEKFVSRVRKMGIGDGHRVIVYDQQGLFSAARVWWTFRVFGHQDVAVLDGGLPKWIADGHPVETEEPDPRERHFTGRRNAATLPPLCSQSNTAGRGQASRCSSATTSAGRTRGTLSSSPPPVICAIPLIVVSFIAASTGLT